MLSQLAPVIINTRILPCISPIRPQVAAIHVICGTVIIAVSHSFYALIFGRVFVGLGVGFGLAVRFSK